MTYTLHYTSQDVAEDSTTLSTWSVYREEYPTPDAEEPIDGSQERVSTWPNEAEADAEANRLQRLVSVQTRTERVEYKPQGEDATWYGTVQRRFTAEDPPGHQREMTVVRFGEPHHEGPEHFMSGDDLDTIGYTASVEVEHDAMPTPEDAAEALVEWIAGLVEGETVAVECFGGDGFTYTVSVRRNAEGRFEGQLTGAYKTERRTRP